MTRAGYIDDLTYWAPTGHDGYGGRTFAAPVKLKGKWEDRTELFIDAAGKEVRSNAVAFVLQDVELEGWLFLGESTDASPTTVSGAYEIRGFRKIKSLDGSWSERKVML